MNNSIGYIITESYGNPNAEITPKTIQGKVVAHCILQTADEKNRNGRYYAEEELFPQLVAPRTVELLRTGTLKAECGHPLSKDLQRQSTIDDTKTCARFLKLWTEGKDIHAHVVGTNNQLGLAFDADLKEGILPAWSLRALGSIEQTHRGAEVRNLRLITWDNVIYPSHPGAYTQGLVTESSSIITDKKSLLLEAIQNNNLLESNNISPEGEVDPFNNEQVIKYIQNESSNLKFIRECFDFAYDDITIDKTGRKVLLTTKEGANLVVNIESYIYDELSRYNNKYEL